MFREDITYHEIGPERDPRKLRAYWDIAKGLQRVDGLETTSFLDEIAKDTIWGKYDTLTATKTVRQHYDSKASHSNEEQEANQAAVNIANLLTRNGFALSSVALRTIHAEIFEGIPLHGNKEAQWAGVYRDHDIGKSEPVLGGKSVHYSASEYIEDQLRITFDAERSYEYPAPFDETALEHFTRFSATLWQVHPFLEGNTRACAVFLIKYLQSMGFEIDNEPFKTHSDYFRDALVRASYFNNAEGIAKDFTYLIKFFENLLFGAEHKLSLDHLDI